GTGEGSLEARGELDVAGDLQRLPAFPAEHQCVGNHRVLPSVTNRICPLTAVSSHCGLGDCAGRVAENASNSTSVARLASFYSRVREHRVGYQPRPEPSLRAH